MNWSGRKHRVIVNLVFAAVVVGILVFRYLPPTVAYWRSSEVYKCYCEVEGIRASYLKDFPLNDTLTVGVTLLEPTTDSGWARLQEDFEIRELSEDEKKELAGNRSVGFKRLPTIEPKDSTERCMTTYSREKKSVCVFHVRDEAQYFAIIMYSINNI